MAARFVFSLQPLLDARRRREEDRQRAFARAREARDENLRELDSVTRAQRAGAIALHERAMGGAAHLAVHDAHLRYLERTIQSRERRSAESARAFDRAAAELLAANRERRALETLEERRRREFEREQTRRDELELEDANRR
jgi:flagellar export protein FliJ